jgi:hypothetical protein
MDRYSFPVRLLHPRLPAGLSRRFHLSRLIAWGGTGRSGSTGVMTEWQGCVKNQLRLGGHDIPAPKLICIDIQPYGSTPAPELADRRGWFPLSTRAGIADNSTVPTATIHDTADGVRLGVRLGRPVALADGARFAIREGGKTVGSGVVTKVVA